MTGVLDKLFGSSARVKIIRLFLLNPDTLFNLKEISRRAKVIPASARREILVLRDIGFIKQTKEKIDEIIRLKKGKIKNKKKKIQGLKLNQFFPFLHPLKNLVLNSVPFNKEKLMKKINSLGRMKLIVLAGIFIQSDESRTDLLLVADSINNSGLQRVLKDIEAKIGREIVYAIFNTKEFLYRLGMYDRFIRDVLDSPHEKAVNKLNI
ncbi:MAG: hypothetical protein HY773_01140 [Candidatus Terrybacteria bacterium]|nr:hypothetical protein [Candidatus Terrybacteria bacterium]